jgi:xanthine dehydrogenase YagT iron-sulfur-binding subunit
MDAEITLRVDGTRHRLVVDTRTTLLNALRERLGITSPKKGCDHGQCGACTVLLDGRRATTCLALAVSYDGAEIVTANGVTDGDELHPVQRAFLDHDGLQCGYCTPGQICSAIGMLDEVKAGWPSSVTEDLVGEVELDDEEIRERMSGNLCRCGAYANIVAASRLPGDQPQRDTVLEQGELITAVDLPRLPMAAPSAYRKVRDRASCAFTLVSVAAAVDVADGSVREARIALGGVAHRPWRAPRAEEALRGAPVSEDAFRRPADAELAQARPLRVNAFKVPMARNTVVAVLPARGRPPDRLGAPRPEARGPPGERLVIGTGVAASMYPARRLASLR